MIHATIGITRCVKNSLSEEYKCLSCTYSDNVSRAEIYSSKISSLIEEEAELNEKVVKNRTTCDNLKGQHSICHWKHYTKNF